MPTATTAFEELVRHLCRYPGMYVSPANVETVSAYLRGFDTARDGGPLCAFREWLIVRLNHGNNLVWEALAPKLFPMVGEDVGFQAGDAESEIRALGAVLELFFVDRKEHGLTKIFHDYGKWLLKHKWYTGSLRKRQD